MKLIEFFQNSHLDELSYIFENIVDKQDAIAKIKKLQNMAGRTPNEIENFKLIINKIMKKFNISPEEISPTASLQDRIAAKSSERKMAANLVKSEYEKMMAGLKGKVKSTFSKYAEDINETIEPDEFRQILKIFLPFAQKIIKLDKLPTIILRKKLDDDHQPTHGRFHNEQYVLEVAIANRQPVDILRTLAHELVHAKQQRDGVMIDPTTGSEDENEANSLAGVVMRHFNKQYPEFLSFQPVAESNKNGRTRIC